MSDELKRLRADLEVIERYSSYAVIENARYDIAEKIKRIENPDPWQKAKNLIELWRNSADNRYVSKGAKDAVSYVDHLTAENERLTERVAKLESDPEFTPAILKRSDEIVSGDVILANGIIRTVTNNLGDADRSLYRIECGEWYALCGADYIFAVLQRPLVEAKENAK
jgi:hypothetical protein